MEPAAEPKWNSTPRLEERTVQLSTATVPGAPSAEKHDTGLPPEQGQRVLLVVTYSERLHKVIVSAERRIAITERVVEEARLQIQRADDLLDEIAATRIRRRSQS